MPKLKTNKSASKRVIGLTSSGKIRIRHTSAQHLATNKSNRSRHNAAHSRTLDKVDNKKYKRLIPYA